KSGAPDPPLAGRMPFQLCAETAQGPGGGMDIPGLQKAGNVGFPFRQRPQDQGPLGNGFVAWDGGGTLARGGFLGAQRLGVLGVHGEAFNTLDKGRHPWQTRPSNNLSHGKHGPWSRRILEQNGRAPAAPRAFTTCRSVLSNVRNAASASSRRRFTSSAAGAS